MAGLGYRRVEVAPIVRDLGPVDRQPRTLSLRDDPEFLFVGRVSPNKCQHDLIAALAMYRGLYHPGARLRLIGGVSSPAYRAALSRIAEDLGVAGAVTIDDHGVPEGQLLAAYERATAFVCGSRHEGFCVPLVEAMRHALPIVALRGSAVTETVAGGGLLLPDNDPLVMATAWHRLASDASVWNDLSAAAVARGTAFDKQVTAKAFLDAFRWAVEDL
jgi:glycosyltransferase involved in cell wall biosynthesis